MNYFVNVMYQKSCEVPNEAQALISWNEKRVKGRRNARYVDDAYK